LVDQGLASPRKKREWANYHQVRDGLLNGERFERLPPTFLDTEVL
jgi:hypothetical protein